MAVARKTPRRGAPPKGEPSARDRILATAGKLFYREGIRAIGIDTIIAESGVSKASLYRNFESKDELVATFLRQRDAAFWSWWDRIEACHPEDPRALLAALADGIAAQIAHADFRGCPFLNAATEFPDPAHPGRQVSRANKDEMHARLAAVCVRLGVKNAEATARQLFLLLNGAYATGQLVGDPHLGRTLVEAAERLTARAP